MGRGRLSELKERGRTVVFDGNTAAVEASDRVLITSVLRILTTVWPDWETSGNEGYGRLVALAEWPWTVECTYEYLLR